jgi:uncharacterized protein (DUF433 family)
MDTEISAIWVDPERMGGVPCFKDTRVPISIMFEYLLKDDMPEFYENYEVTHNQVIAVLNEAQNNLLNKLTKNEKIAA